MSSLRLTDLLLRPQALRDLAMKQSYVAAVAVNAINGIFLMIALWVQMQQMFTVSLIITIGILFGPLAGFIISSTYSRVEWLVERTLNGRAARDELYRLFSWSLLPLSFVALINSIILIKIGAASGLANAAILLPTVIALMLTLRNYCVNLSAIQRFSVTRGAAGLFLATISWLIVMCLGLAVLSLVISFGSGQGFREMLSQISG